MHGDLERLTDGRRRLRFTRRLHHGVPEGTELTLLDTLDERGKAARDGSGWHNCLELSTPAWTAVRTGRKRSTAGLMFTPST